MKNKKDESPLTSKARNVEPSVDTPAKRRRQNSTSPPRKKRKYSIRNKEKESDEEAKETSVYEKDDTGPINEFLASETDTLEMCSSEKNSQSDFLIASEKDTLANSSSEKNSQSDYLIVPGAKEDSQHPNILSYNDDDSSDEENPEDCLLEQAEYDFTSLDLDDLTPENTVDEPISIHNVNNNACCTTSLSKNNSPIESLKVQDFCITPPKKNSPLTSIEEDFLLSPSTASDRISSEVEFLDEKSVNSVSPLLTFPGHILPGNNGEELVSPCSPIGTKRFTSDTGCFNNKKRTTLDSQCRSQTQNIEETKQMTVKSILNNAQHISTPSRDSFIEEKPHEQNNQANQNTGEQIASTKSPFKSPVKISSSPISFEEFQQKQVKIVINPTELTNYSKTQFLNIMSLKPGKKHRNKHKPSKRPSEQKTALASKEHFKESSTIALNKNSDFKPEIINNMTSLKRKEGKKFADPETFKSTDLTQEAKILNPVCSSTDKCVNLNNNSLTTNRECESRLNYSPAKYNILWESYWQSNLFNYYRNDSQQHHIDQNNVFEELSLPEHDRRQLIFDSVLTKIIKITKFFNKIRNVEEKIKTPCQNIQDIKEAVVMVKKLDISSKAGTIHNRTETSPAKLPNNPSTSASSYFVKKCGKKDANPSTNQHVNNMHSLTYKPKLSKSQILKQRKKTFLKPKQPTDIKKIDCVKSQSIPVNSSKKSDSFVEDKRIIKKIGDNKIVIIKKLGNSPNSSNLVKENTYDKKRIAFSDDSNTVSSDSANNENTSSKKRITFNNDSNTVSSDSANNENTSSKKRITFNNDSNTVSSDSANNENTSIKKRITFNNDSNTVSSDSANHDTLKNSKASSNLINISSDFQFPKPKPVSKKLSTNRTISSVKGKDHCEISNHDEDDNMDILSISVRSELINEFDVEEIDKEDKSSLKSTSICSNIEENNEYDHLNNQYPNNVINWVNDQMQGPSLSSVPEDGFNGDPMLRKTLFQNYCLQYMRSSISENEHDCGLLHEVPLILHQTSRYGDGVDIADAIEVVIRLGFNNPPEQIIKAFVHFCVLTDRRTLLERIGKALKNNIEISLGNEEVVKRMWTYFIDSFLLAKKYDKLKGDTRHSHLNNILKSIFSTNGIVESVYYKVIDVILQVLSELTRSHKGLRIMNCVDFLNDNHYFRNNGPACFKLTVINQVITSQNCIFAYKVYKNFFDGNKLVDMELYTKNQLTLDRFFEMFSQSKYSYIRNPFKKMLNHRTSPRSSDSGSLPEGSRKCDPFINVGNWKNLPGPSHSYTDSPAPNINLKRLITRNKVNPAAIAHAVVGLQLTERDLKDMFDTFKTIKDGQLVYLKMLQHCPDDVKVALNGLTLSFLILESRNRQPCYEFYEQVKNLDSRSVEPYIGKVSLANVILFSVDSCLGEQQLEEAVNLFINYGFCTDEKVNWKAKYFENDVVIWDKVCKAFTQSFYSTSQDFSIMGQLFNEVIRAQKSLLSPIDVRESLPRFISHLFQLSKISEAIKLVKTILDYKLLKDFRLEKPYQYRSLINKMVDIGDHRNSRLLLYIARNHVGIYPHSMTNIQLTDLQLKTGLTSQEMIAILDLKKQLSGDLIGKQNLNIIFLEQPVPSHEEIPELDNTDCSVGAAIDRFKIALKKFLPNAGFYMKSNNMITIDRITLVNGTESLNRELS